MARESTIVVRSDAPGARYRLPEVGVKLGRYKLVSVLGEGAFGRVYVAEHRQTGDKVALKMLRPSLQRKAQAVRRFFGEAIAASKIDHDNIVRIHEFVEADRYPSYIVMELLEGQTLEKALDDGPLPIPQMLEVSRQLCGALHAAHSRGIVHRDLKPENVFLTRQADDKVFVKLLDFGIAKLTGDYDERARAQTLLGHVVGTPEYMAPEQVNGATADHRADIYGLGLLMYEMLTGVRFAAAPSAVEAIQKHFEQKVEPPSDCPTVKTPIPRRLDKLVVHCLQKPVDERPPSIEQVGLQLKQIAETKPLMQRKEGWLLVGGILAAIGLLITALNFYILD